MLSKPDGPAVGVSYGFRATQRYCQVEPVENLYIAIPIPTLISAREKAAKAEIAKLGKKKQKENEEGTTQVMGFQERLSVV